VFDSYDTTRLQQWKEFRSSLETSSTPFEDVAHFWSRAPFVYNFLDPFDSKSWPDPWQLILDNKFDDLGITLGMCYTLQLTERFKDHEFEIHMSMSQSKKDWRYMLVVNKDIALNWNFGSVAKYNEIDSNLTKIWSK
jgi:hypothetical protein